MGSSQYQQPTAIEKLTKLFPDREVTEASLEQVLSAAGKDPEDPKSRQWLRDTLRFMSTYRFVEKRLERSPSGATRIASLKLTSAGLKALGRAQETQDSNRPSLLGHPVDIEQVNQDVKRLREQYPSLDFTFDIKLKEQA